MSLIRRAILAFALIAGFAPAMAQVPPPVPALPDTERRTTYSISGTTCICAVNFALYGDSTDYANWLEVFVNGVLMPQSGNWTITSPTGSLATIPRPITDAVLTFTNAQTGTVQIVGARRPRRASQFSENAGVPARAFNQVLTDIIAQNREIWDKTNDFTGRGVFGVPGETMALLPPAASRANQNAIFDAFGNLTPGTPITGGGVISSAMQPVVSSATLAAGRTAFGLGAIAVEGIGAGLQDDGAGNVRIKTQAAFTTLANPTSSAAVPIATQSGFLHSKDFGAVGNNSTDDTTALQNWITACQTNSLICFLDAGSYKTTAALNVTAAITIIGTGRDTAILRPSSTTLDCIAVNTTARVSISNLQLQGPSSTGVATSTAGNLLSFTAPSTGFNLNSVVRDVFFIFGFNDINFIQAAVWTVDNIFIQNPVNTGITIADLGAGDSGDQVINNSLLESNGLATAISQTSAGGLKLANTKIINWATGYNLTLSTSISTSQLNIVNNNFDTVATCITLNKGTGTIFGNIIINGNQIGGFTGFGITDDNNASWISNLVVTGNHFSFGSGGTGIRLQQLAGFTIASNELVGGGGTPTGIAISSGASNGLIGANHYSGMTTKYTNASTSTVIVDPEGIAFASLPAAAANGSQIFLTNGAPASGPCTGASTGSTAMRQNGAWKCF